MIRDKNNIKLKIWVMTFLLLLTVIYGGKARILKAEDIGTAEGVNTSESIVNTQVSNEEGLYELAKDEDFKFVSSVLPGSYPITGDKRGYFLYTGDAEYVEIPDYIQGERITAYFRMFYGHSGTVKGVKSTNTSVRNMGNMFENARFTSLDVGELDTSGVTSMVGMFYNAEIGNLQGLTSLDTSNVTSMEIMFEKSNIPSLDVSNFVTGNVEVMTRMFKDSGSVKISGLDKLDTSRVYTMHGMFEGAKVEELDLSNFNTSAVTNMSSMFKNSAVKTLDVGDFNTQSTTNMSGMFQNVKAPNIDTSKFSTGNVVNMSYMFTGTDTEELKVSHFDTHKVVNMDRMFLGSKAGIVDVKNFNTSEVTRMREMFKDSGAGILDFSNWDTRNVLDMVGMFQNSNVDILDLESFSTFRVSDMSRMFSGSKVSSVNLSNFDTSYVISMREMFTGVNLEELDLSSFNMVSVNDTKGMFTGSTVTKGISRSLSDSDKLNNSDSNFSGGSFEPKYRLANDEDFIGTINGSFKYVGESRYIEMPISIRGTNLTSYKGMFAGTSVRGVISDNENIVDMSAMFKGNTSEELDVSSINTVNVKNMSGMFEGTSAGELNLKGFLTDSVTDMSNMFKDSSVKILDLGNFDLSNVENVQGMFLGATADRGYVRTEDDLNVVNASEGKPEKLVFNIWGVRISQNPNDWVNGKVELSVLADSEGNTIDNIELLNIQGTGRNLLPNSNFADLDKLTMWNTEVEISQDERFGNVMKSGDNFVRGWENYLDVEEGDTVTVSFYAKSDTASYTDVAIEGRQIAYAQRVNLSDEWEYYEITYNVNGVGNNALRFYGDGTKYLANIKYEMGSVATPWTPAPEDLGITNEAFDKFTVTTNGSYVFRVTDSIGDTRTVSYSVDNIDTKEPDAVITKSTEGKTGQGVVLYVDATDDLSGVSKIVLPDGEEVSSNRAEFIAGENGEYTFKVYDKAGNVHTDSVSVSNIDKTIPLLDATVDTTEWTRGDVGITVSSDSTVSGLKYLVQDNIPDKGRNLLVTKQELEGKYLDMSGNLVNNSEHNTMKEYIKVNPGETLTFTKKSISSLTEGGYYRWNFYDANKEFVGREPSSSNDFQWVVPDGVHYIWVSYPKGSQPKVERGSESTSYSIAPEDEPFTGNTRRFTVTENGLYVYKATYGDNTTSEVSVNIQNIDREVPELLVDGNPDDWVEEDEIILDVKGVDNQSGVKSLTLPNGEVVEGSSQYVVSKNGSYEFVLEDKVGNKKGYTIKVDKLMMRYFFYIKDEYGQPIEGAGFELIRDGEVHTTAESQSNGLVDFGKVPPTGKYTIRQVKAPDGHVVNPEEKPVDIEDNTDPEEFISHPRGKQLPATGKASTLVVYSTILVLGIGLGVSKIRVRMLKIK